MSNTIPTVRSVLAELIAVIDAAGDAAHGREALIPRAAWDLAREGHIALAEEIVGVEPFRDGPPPDASCLVCGYVGKPIIWHCQCGCYACEDCALVGRIRRTRINERKAYTHEAEGFDWMALANALLMARDFYRREAKAHGCKVDLQDDPEWPLLTEPARIAPGEGA